MSYINLLILKLNNLSLLEHSVLQLCKQARIEDVSSTLKENGKIIISLQKKGLISTIKGKKGEDECKLWRATKIGTELLDYISTPDILDGDIQMFHYLCDMYLQEDKNRKIGNRKASLICCAQFRQILSLTLHEMYYLCEMFINNMAYTKILEYIFFERKHNPYGKFKDNLEASKLYQFWMDNEYEIRDYWKLKIKE